MLKTLGIKEVAKICYCRTDSIYKAIRAGHLQARKVGRKWVILEDNLLEFLNTTDNAPCSTNAAKSITPVLPPAATEYTDLRALQAELRRNKTKPGWSANLVLWLPYWPFEPYLSLFIIGLGTLLATKTRD